MKAYFLINFLDRLKPTMYSATTYKVNPSGLVNNKKNDFSSFSSSYLSANVASMACLSERMHHILPGKLQCKRQLNVPDDDKNGQYNSSAMKDQPNEWKCA